MNPLAHSPVSSSHSNPDVTTPKRKESSVQVLHSLIAPLTSIASKKWSERAIVYLNGVEKKLEERIPNFPFQNKIDQLGRDIKAKFAPLTKFNAWLDSNGQGEWYRQFAVFLAKLPVRAVRNIVRLLYTIIKGITCAAVHPLKACTKLAKLLVRLAHALTQPETWSKIGVGMIGASLGQALVTGNPISLVGLGIGAAMTIGGLSIGALKAALKAPQGQKFEAATANLLSQAKQLPESALTGFCMGLLIGAIQRTIMGASSEAKRLADAYIKEHHFPPYSRAYIDGSGNLNVVWQGNRFKDIFPIDDFVGRRGFDLNASYLKVELTPQGTGMQELNVVINHRYYPPHPPMRCPLGPYKNAQERWVIHCTPGGDCLEVF